LQGSEWRTDKMDLKPHCKRGKQEIEKGGGIRAVLLSQGGWRVQLCCAEEFGFSDGAN